MSGMDKKWTTEFVVGPGDGAEETVCRWRDRKLIHEKLGKKLSHLTQNIVLL
jgi:hypothetical protein